MSTSNKSGGLESPPKCEKKNSQLKGGGCDYFRVPSSGGFGRILVADSYGPPDESEVHTKDPRFRWFCQERFDACHGEHEQALAGICRRMSAEVDELRHRERLEAGCGQRGFRDSQLSYPPPVSQPEPEVPDPVQTRTPGTSGSMLIAGG